MNEIWLEALKVGGSLVIFLFFMWRIQYASQKQLLALIDILAKTQQQHSEYTFHVLKQQNMVIETAFEMMRPRKDIELLAIQGAVSDTQESKTTDSPPPLRVPS